MNMKMPKIGTSKIAKPSGGGRRPRLPRAGGHAAFGSGGSTAFGSGGLQAFGDPAAMVGPNVAPLEGSDSGAGSIAPAAPPEG
jgi:hypothetical protein